MDLKNTKALMRAAHADQRLARGLQRRLPERLQLGTQVGCGMVTMSADAVQYLLDQLDGVQDELGAVRVGDAR